MTDDAVRDYYEGGSGDEVTLRGNEAAWQALRFRPHVLRDVSRVSTEVEVLGARLAAPIGVAPSALHGLAHEDGERATAQGAAAAGSLLVLSGRSSVPPAEVAAAAGGAPWWFQVYAMRSRAVTFAVVEAAAAAGARALVLTGDTPVVGRKHRATPGIRLPELHLAHVREWTGLDVAADDVQQDPGITPALIGELQAATGLPVLVKGVLRGDDALEVLAAGAAGVVVSNHGGRQLDRALPTAEALPDVVAAVAGAAPVLVDGGIRSGLDVLAALALGADAAFVGRPALRALMRDGAAGVAHELDRLREDLAHGMALAGARDVSELTPDLLAPR